MCQNTSLNSDPPIFWAFGYFSNNYTYLPTGYHNGVDFFTVSGSSMYSVGTNGLVVGIGRGQPGEAAYSSTTSTNTWGAAYVNEGDGYNVVVRYGSLYVLYGHLKSIDPKIYVGALISNGTRIGKNGTVSTAHLHAEVRNYGESTSSLMLTVPSNPNDPLATYNQPNKYGILKLGANQGTKNVYDIGQFFFPSSDTYGQDKDSGASNIKVEGLGPNLQFGDPIKYGKTCTIPYVRNFLTPSIPTVPPGANPGYRGFVLGQSDLVAPIDPNYQVAQPSNYP